MMDGNDGVLKLEYYNYYNKYSTLVVRLEDA